VLQMGGPVCNQKTGGEACPGVGCVFFGGRWGVGIACKGEGRCWRYGGHDKHTTTRGSAISCCPS
jgi:hypothetical protein